LTSFLNQPDIEDTTWDTTDLTITCESATIRWPVTGDTKDEDASTPIFRLKDVDLTLPTGKFTLVCGPLGCGKTLFVSYHYRTEC